MSAVRIAIYQAQSGIDPTANAERLAAAVREAAAGGAAMLFTPEMSGMLDRDRQRALGKAQREAEDQVLAQVRQAAANSGIWVHLGSLALKGEGEKLVNRGFVIDGRGDVRARYDKIHLFDVDLPTGESWRESAMYDGGDRAVVVPDTPVGKLGLTICYDLRFPELFQRLSDAGADVIAVPAAFTVPSGKAHWHILMRARAIEAELFIVAAAQAGRHEDGRETYGHSLIADPWGELVPLRHPMASDDGGPQNLSLDLGDQPGLAFADIDLVKIANVRASIPVHQHRKSIPPVAN